jgi:hypothetical protein
VGILNRVEKLEALAGGEGACVCPAGRYDVREYDGADAVKDAARDEPPAPCGVCGGERTAIQLVYVKDWGREAE